MATVEEALALASQLLAAGNWQMAEHLYRQVIQAVPNIAEVHSCLGVTLARQGRYELAIASFEQALRYRSDFAEAHNDLANVLQALGRLDEAVTHYQYALQCRPTFPEAHNNLGVVRARQGNLDMAVTHHRQALRLQPNYASAHYNLGSALERQGHLKQAENCYRQALELQPTFAEAWNNLGNVLRSRDQLEEAIHAYGKSLACKPDYAAAHSNLANVLSKQGKYLAAIEHYQRALRYDPDFVRAHYNRALLWLLLGNWAQGFQEYEWRLQTDDFPHIPFRQPRWDGSPLAGRTLLVLAEQGLGDTLQFIRYLPLIQKGGSRVIFLCQPLLQRLVVGYLGAEHVIVEGDVLPPFDVYAHLLSLPRIMGTTPTTIPASVPYLHADAEAVEHWRLELAPRESLGVNFNVGIAWQGNPAHAGDHQRSIPLTRFGALAADPRVQLISLQKGAGSEQLQSLGGRFAVKDVGCRIHDFMDTAAVMMNLDLVISIDTALVHLAGALGVPVWVALPFAPDWRWLLEREDSPWYPTMRLFRQSRFGDWSDVFQRLDAELRARVGG